MAESPAKPIHNHRQVFVHGHCIGGAGDGLLPFDRTGRAAVGNGCAGAVGRAAERIEGRDGSPQATESALRARDAKDSARAVSPLTRADGAIEIDTTNLSFDEVVAAVIELARQVAR